MKLDPKKSELKTRLAHYAPSALFLWLAVIFYRTDIYYKGFLTPTTQKALLAFAISYTIIGFFVYLLVPIKRLPTSKSYVAIKYFGKFFSRLKQFHKDFVTRNEKSSLKLSPEERTAVLFLLVKFFFIPLMINFLFGNYDALTASLRSIHGSTSLFSAEGFNNLLFPLLFNVILLVDTAFFTFGYLFEASFLGNKVRSVDPTYFGWIVCLASYPPFNNLVSGYTSWYANNDNYFHNVYATFLVRFFVILLMAVYASASVALGAKASNLTNRGIVGYGPYKYMRHPAYVTKNLAWWLVLLPILSVPAFLSMAAWSLVYYLRAITEERHLFRDPDYQKYCQKVQRRFIPYIKLFPEPKPIKVKGTT